MHKNFTVSIDTLTFETIIGILAYERETPQKVNVDITFEYSYDPNAKEFIDYAQVAQLIEMTMCEKKFELIEEAVLYLETLLYKTYPMKNLKIKIAKPDILENCVVSVGI